MADPDREIDAVFDQVDHAIRQPQLTGDLRIAGQIGRHDRADMEAAKANRRRDHQPSTRPRPFALRRTFGLLDIGEDAPDTFQIARADIGQRHRARGPLQQPRPETILQRRHQPCDRRRRQPQSARRRRKTPEVGHRDKGLHGIQAIHGIISYLAIMKCQSRGLFKFRKGSFCEHGGRLAHRTWRSPMSDITLIPATWRSPRR